VVEDDAGYFRCSVCDNGGGSPGLRADRGRRLVQALAAELGGSVAWSFAPNGRPAGAARDGARPGGGDRAGADAPARDEHLA
jgi:hypothetical protein